MVCREPPIDYAALITYSLSSPLLATICVKLLSEQSYFVLYFIMIF